MKQLLLGQGQVLFLVEVPAVIAMHGRCVAKLEAPNVWTSRGRHNAMHLIKLRTQISISENTNRHELL